MEFELIRLPPCDERIKKNTFTEVLDPSPSKGLSLSMRFKASAQNDKLTAFHGEQLCNSETCRIIFPSIQMPVQHAVLANAALYQGVLNTLEKISSKCIVYLTMDNVSVQPDLLNNSAPRLC